MIDLNSLSTRQLQLESARALVIMEAKNSTLAKFNKKVDHDSIQWYKNVISWYVEQHGDLPSKIGPAKEVKLIFENV